MTTSPLPSACACALLLLAFGCDEPQPPPPVVTENAPVVVPESAPTPPPSPAAAAEPRPSVELAPADGPLAEQLATHTARAREANLKPVLYAHASWCPPCNAISEHRDHPAMREAFAGTYVIQVDMDRFHDEELLSSHGIGRAIPMWVALDAQGRPTDRRIDGGAWGEDVPANMAPPLRAFFASI